MPANYITLSRTKLYELVWSKPVRDVAAAFGISDVALAKRCRLLRIPLPPRGYWARVTAGQRPKRPPLPPFTESRRTHLPSYVTTRGHTTTDPEISFEPDRAAERLVADDSNLPAITVSASTDLAQTLAIVRRTARHYRHPRSANLPFARGEATGPIVRLDVSPESLDRALLVADTFLKAATELGWTPIPPRKPEPPDPRHYYGRPPQPKPDRGPHFADLDIDGHRIEFAIEERHDLRELPPTPADLARKKKEPWLRPETRHEKLWSGRLRLKRPGYRYPYGVDGKSWFETANRTLDSLIPKILADFKAVATRMTEVDDQREREARERERQARLAAELTKRRAANAEKIQDLERQAGAWSRARYLRRYLRAAQRTLTADSDAADITHLSLEFLAWAEHYVNQLDPLHPEPRDPDLAHEHSWTYGSDEKRWTEELQRLYGHAWEGSRKLAPSSKEVRHSTIGPDPDDA